MPLLHHGLGHDLVLKRRATMRISFEGFDVDRVSAFGTADVARLLADPGIIRNRLKVEAIISNARTIQGLRQSHGSFFEWLDAHHPLEKPEWMKLFRRTFRFTGGEIVGEFLMSLGWLPGAHAADCPVQQSITLCNPRWSSRHISPT